LLHFCFFNKNTILIKQFYHNRSYYTRRINPMGSKTIVSQGEDMVVSHLDASYLGLEKSLLVVDGTTGNMSFKDLAGDEILGLNVSTGVLSINGQPAVGATGINLALSGTLSVAGVSTLSSVSLASGADVVAVGGASDLDMSLSSGLTKTGTGAVSLNGAVTVASAKSLTSAGGAADLDWSASSGLTKTGTGAVSVNGAVTLAANKGIAALAGTASLDLSLATGTMKTPTGIETHNGKQNAGAAVNLIPDPGNAGAISVATDGVCAITTAGAETSTLAAPTFVGQELCIICDTQAVGARVITVASAINKAGNTIITLAAAKDMIALKAMTVAGVKVWRVVATDGAALS
jgi:hypothetical protein